MSAIGNYEVVTEAFDVTGLVNELITVPVPSGKVALGWGAHNEGVKNLSGVPVPGVFNLDLVISGFPATDGSSVTFHLYEQQSGGGAFGTLYVTCAEMGC